MERGMSNENLNDYWKNKLEDEGSLSAETFTDKNAAWEKLHNRLHQMPQRTKALGYWAAAACLLLAIMIPAMMFNKKQDGFLKTNPTQILPKKRNVPEIKPSKENAVANISPSLIIKKKPVKPLLHLPGCI